MTRDVRDHPMKQAGLAERHRTIRAGGPVPAASRRMRTPFYATLLRSAPANAAPRRSRHRGQSPAGELPGKRSAAVGTRFDPAHRTHPTRVRIGHRKPPCFHEVNERERYTDPCGLSPPGRQRETESRRRPRRRPRRLPRSPRAAGRRSVAAEAVDGNADVPFGGPQPPSNFRVGG